jgi:hypothetical protein
MTEEAKRRKLDDAKEWVADNFGRHEIINLFAEAIATGNGFKELIELLDAERENFLKDYEYK